MTIISEFYEKHLKDKSEFYHYSCEVFQLVSQTLVEDYDGDDFDDAVLYEAVVLYFSDEVGNKHCLCSFNGAIFEFDEHQVKSIIEKDIITNDIVIEKEIDPSGLKKLISGLRSLSLLSVDENDWNNEIGEYKTLENSFISKSFYGDKNLCKVGDDSILTLRHMCLDELEFDEDNPEYLYHFCEPIDFNDPYFINEQIDMGDYDKSNIESCSVSFI